MASQGPLYPGTAADNASVGTTAWTNVNNIKVSGDFAYATSGNKNNENSVKIIKGGTITGTDQSTGAALPDYGSSPSSMSVLTYGTSSYLWGTTWSYSDINNSGFGFAFSSKYYTGSPVSHYLTATNFGFSIPSGATINGIVVEIRTGQSSDVYQNYVDYVRITVHYTEGSSAVVKTSNGLALASVKTFNGLALASTKTKNGAATV
jgi:hypothetical protein